ncbi:uncharacterized protein LOC6559412 [Drosophila grimshawi]|uniref:GH21319 n=1 Tax=Drosophila grimshawi TaxID=7222 RepID=B4J890_DROGR|nr:uncharacterized protein LOC6559412 [Drosophila grimshawi]EDW01227.1 GH21319 [Drosophila grimshawi]
MNNCDDEMAYVLDEELLTSMKSTGNTSNKNDEENLDVELKPPVEAYADPLQETALISSNFSWLFKDEDILLNDAQLAELLMLKPGKVRGKRGRPTSSSSSSNVSISWDTETDVQQPRGQDELLLPRQQASGKGPANSVSNAVESWMLLFDDEMMRMLLRQANERIRQRRARNSAERQIDLTEMRSWLGLSYLCGVFRNAQHNGPLEELWTLELGNAIFRATMSLARFEFIAESLHSQAGSSWNDAQHLWQKLLINCRSYYGPSGWLCVDEQPALENGNLALCCDAKTLYMTNALLKRDEQAPGKELMQLICDYKTTGRNLTLGTRYACLRHCEQLLQRNLSSICLLPSTAPDYPKNWTGEALRSGSKRLTRQAGGALLSCGLDSHVNVSQAQLHTGKICERFFELSQRYSCALSQSDCRRNEFLQQLHLMLNVAAVNAWILLRLSPKGDTKMEQRDFQRQLGLFLTQQRLQRRLQRRSATATTLVMRLQICEILGQSSQRLLSEASADALHSNGVGVVSLTRATLPEGVTLVSRYGEKHRRCKPCARNKRETKARSRCQQCQAHRCGNHLISRCYECMGLATAQLPDGNIKDT